MRSETHQITVVTYYSEVKPDVYTDRIDIADVIAWADEHPVAWDIVTRKRSRVFGVGSCEYIGWAQDSMHPGPILQRLIHFYDLLHKPETDIFHWRAHFTFEHYRDKGFKGGFFQQHDERSPRGCLSLDYTPELREEVINKFLEGCCNNYYYTKRVTIDDETVKEFQLGG